MAAAKLRGPGRGRIGNHYCANAVQVGIAGLGEDWSACEYGGKQDRYHYSFHVGSSHKLTNSHFAMARSRPPGFFILRHNVENTKEIQGAFISFAVSDPDTRATHHQ